MTSERRAGSTATLVEQSPPRTPTVKSSRPGARADLGASFQLAWCRQHAAFLTVLLAGLALRIVALVAFRPALVVEESDAHLSILDGVTPGTAHPVGYALFELTPLSWFTDALTPVVVAQHLLGLATGIVVYLLLARWGVWRWFAALATLPVLLDPRELASEHLVLPDTFFGFLLAVAVLALCWQARPGLVAALTGGILLGVAATVRPMGVPLIMGAVAMVLLTGATWRSRFVAASVVMIGLGLSVGPYVAWYHQEQGEDAFAQLQTGDDPGVETWQFSSYLPPGASPVGDLYSDHGGEQLEVTQPAADALAKYQGFAHLPGRLLLVGPLVGVLAGLGLGRAGSSGMRSVCLLTALVPAGILLAGSGAADLNGRDQLPALVLWPAAAALGLTALLRGRRASAASQPQIDDVDRAALGAFRDRYAEPALAPVVVVIAAYNEATGLPRVLSSMPSTVCGLAADVVVVDDGSTDGTADAAKASNRVYVVSCPVNRGQGAAMRLGYRVARDHGAQYIITTDADAQYDTADFPTVLTPLLEGAADFVTGSRRLGRQHTIDRFRRAGVYVFAWIVSALTGERLTDTSFGLRAMRAQVTATVTLNQAQYQSAELLIGAHSHGYRILEVPGTMHMRAAGSTKKGGNLIYGLRYARVVLGTWWREGCPAPARERAPAMSRSLDSVGSPLSSGR
ncbi:MAG: glycosyltransferase [Nocardioidaceae bacterium]|nr:glycosyltransferase [Nocardioidaceae bacterium]